MLKYGTDKPDLRNPIDIADVTEEFNDPTVTFNAFKNVIKAGGVVRAIPAPEAAAQPRSFFDKLNDWARQDMGARGSGLHRVRGRRRQGTDRQVHSRRRAGEDHGQGRRRGGRRGVLRGRQAGCAAKLAGAARTRIGEELGLIAKDRFEFCWIVDFPMYEWNEEEKKIDFSHNPFSMPNMAVGGFPRARSGRSRKDSFDQGDPIRHRLQRR